MIRSNRRLVAQLIENVICHAIEHSGSEVAITVGTLSSQSGFYVEAEDPGIL